MPIVRPMNGSKRKISLIRKPMQNRSYDNRTEEAWEYYHRMLKFIEKDKIIEFFSYFNKALIYTSEKHYSQAVDCFRKAAADKLTNEQKEKILLSVTDIMENTQEFYDCNFSLERLAELIESNSRYVSVVINETYNKNFRTFINEYRIKEAQLRLMNTALYGNYTIKAIAESVGFKSSTNFISAFKDVTGITPSIYQKIAQGR